MFSWSSRINKNVSLLQQAGDKEYLAATITVEQFAKRMVQYIIAKQSPRNNHSITSVTSVT
jgi:hypothetical protein